MCNTLPLLKIIVFFSFNLISSLIQKDNRRLLWMIDEIIEHVARNNHLFLQTNEL